MVFVFKNLNRIKQAHVFNSCWKKAGSCFAMVVCCAFLCLGQPFAQAEEALVDISDEDLVKLYRLLEDPYPSVDPMMPIEYTRALRLLLEEGVDPYPFLSSVAFDPGAPLEKRVKSIVWLGAMANPDIRDQPDPRVVPCLHELLGELLNNPNILGPIEQMTAGDPPLIDLLTSVFDALSRTKDESSVDLILPLTTATFWDNTRALEIRLLPHIKFTPEEHRRHVIARTRERGIYAIAWSGTERSLEVFGVGDKIDFTGMKMGNAREKSLDNLLDLAIYSRAGIKVIPEDPATLPEDKRRELGEIRQRVETRYLPLRKGSGEQKTDGR